jgi:hypothetical protein
MVFTRGGAASREGRDQNSWTRDHIKWRHQNINMVSYEKRAFFSIDRPPFVRPDVSALCLTKWTT